MVVRPLSCEEERTFAAQCRRVVRLMAVRLSIDCTALKTLLYRRFPQTAQSAYSTTNAYNKRQYQEDPWLTVRVSPCLPRRLDEE